MYTSKICRRDFTVVMYIYVSIPFITVFPGAQLD